MKTNYNVLSFRVYFIAVFGMAFSINSNYVDVFVISAGLLCLGLILQFIGILKERD